MFSSFDIKVHNQNFSGYILRLDGCIWIWTGNSTISCLGLSHFPSSSMLIDTPNTQNISVKALTTRIAKQFKDKQVFFSSDIDNEDPHFWQEMYTKLQPELEKSIVTAE